MHSYIIQAKSAVTTDLLIHIYNLSFSQGIFPNILKSAINVLIYKNSTKIDPNNYRPISI